jgi:hypothetical protein
MGMDGFFAGDNRGNGEKTARGATGLTGFLLK